MKRKFSNELWLKMHKLDVIYTGGPRGRKEKCVTIPEKYLYIGNEAFLNDVKAKTSEVSAQVQIHRKKCVSKVQPGKRIAFS